jgi:protein TonB
VITPINLDQRNELGEKIKSYKSHLTEVQNLVLSLVYFEGLNEEEIAKRLSVPVVTVRQKTLSIMESLHNQYTGKSEEGNKKVSPLIKLEALGCLSSEERKLLSELRKNDPDFLWKELGEYQNLTALLAATISIEYPPHELNSEIRDIFIKISGGSEVDYKIIPSEHTLIGQIKEPIKETIQQKIQSPIPESVTEPIHSKIRTTVPEQIQQKIQSSAPETIEQKIQNPISETVSEPIRQKIESPIPVTNKQPEPQEKKKPEFELKFRERDPKELSLLRNLEKNDSSKKPAEVLAKTINDIKLKNYNTAEKNPGVFVDKKVDYSTDKKLTPTLSKTESLQPLTPSSDTNKNELEIKNDDPSIIIDKPKPAIVNEEVTVKNRLIPNSSINLKELLKNEERKIINKESTLVNIKEENKTEVMPVQPVVDKRVLESNPKPPLVDKPVLESKTNEPIKEIHRFNPVVAKEEKNIEQKSASPVFEKSEIKIKSNEPTKELGRSNVFVDKYQKVIPDKPVEPDVKKSEPQPRKAEPAKEIQKIDDTAAKTEKSVEIKSPQVVKKDDSRTAVKIPLIQNDKASSESKKDDKLFQQIKPAVDKSNLKIRETVFAENEKKNDIVDNEIKTPVAASKQVVEKVNTSSKITETINIDEILSKIENEKPEPPVISETESYEKEIIRLRKKLRRNILVSAAVFAILAASSIFIYLNFQNSPAKVVDKGTNTEKINLASQTNLLLNEGYKPEVETENLVEKNESALSEQPLTNQKVFIPPLPEISTKEESTLFAANVNTDLISNDNREPTQIAAAKTENITPPKENKVVEEEPAFFVAVEEMPELIGGIKGLQSKIVYPEIAKRVGVEGKVIVQAIVDETGKVVSVSTIKGIGSGCDEVAMDAVRNSKFTPGKQRGKTVKTQVTIPIVFKK